MKKDCFSYFYELCEISRSFSSALSAGKCENKTELFKRSCKLRNECADYALKQFLPPIDRTDVVSICFAIHRMNKSLYELILLKEGYFTKSNNGTGFEPLCKICDELAQLFKNSLPKDLSKLPKTDDVYPAFHNYSGRLSQYGTTVMQKMHNKTCEVLDCANTLIERIAIAIINNV